MVTLWWPLGLIAGAGVATLELHRTALSETWEALTLAPVAGAVGVILVAYCAEVWIRSRTWVIGLSGLIALAFGAGALTVEPWVSMTGDDNLAVHEARWGGTGLGLLERLTDQDKDGFSPYFGHGDCDDASASTWPGSSEGHDCLVAVETLTDDEMQKLMGRATKRSADEPSSGVDVGTVDAPPVKSKQSKDERDVDSSAATQDSPDSGHAFGQAKEPLQSPKKQVPTALDRPLNMVLITVDTVRADHCGFQGYERDTTPRLDEFARESVVFEKAYAPSNMTPVSIPALLSGRYTSELFRDDAHFIHFDEKNVFVAESLSDAGYETRGILTHWYFEKRKRSGLYQGFDHWSVMGTRWGKAMEDVSTSELVSAEAVRQLQQVPSEQPWFMWIHFLDPHKWYIDHPGFDRRWGRKSRDRYDHEIAFTDHHIGVVLDALRSHPQWKRTAVFISSDHGEAFGEHKTNFHGFSMYEDQLHVPFIVRVPGLEPRRISKRVGLIDVVPTIRELAQLPAVDELHGRSLLAELRGEEVEQRLIYAERPRGPYSAGQRALIQGDHKLVWRAAGNRYELYDLANDPDELNDLTGDMAPMDTRMRAIMATFVNTVLDRKGKVRRGRR
jgi:arylsulfatase A-like enzyme